MARKQFILVAGVDWLNFTIDYGLFCENRMRILLRNHAGSALKFTILNFAKGTITTVETERPGVSTTKTEKKFKPILAKEYRIDPEFPGDPDFIGKAKGKMSVVDVYKAVQQIGKDSPGELVEMSWFYRGMYHSYPDLTHTYQYLEDRSYYLRSPESLDPDFYLDFAPQNMNRTKKDGKKSDFENFTSAFSSDGYIWLWGGYLIPSYAGETDFELFKALEKSLGAILYTGIPDTSLIDISGFTASQYERLSDRLELHFYLTLREEKTEFTFLPDLLEKRTPFPREFLVDKVPFSFIKYFISGVESSAGVALMHATKIKTYAASEYLPDEPDDSSPTGLFHIPEKFGSYIDFFRTYYNIKTDPEDRLYMEYTAAFTGVDRPRVYDFFIPKFKIPDEPKKPELLPEQIDREFRELKLQGHQFIFVAGVDFVSNDNDRIDFYQLCIDRVKVCMDKYVNFLPIQFQILDFTSGTVSYIDSRMITKTPLKVKLYKSIDPAKDYDLKKDQSGFEQRFFRGKEGVMRVNEIYDRIVDIGRRNPGKLVELSFFSHGNEQGPLLTNYLDPATEFKPGKKARSNFRPDEILRNELLSVREKALFDLSVLFDFESALSGIPSFTEFFKKAWYQDAEIYAWGYTTTPNLSLLMQALLRENINITERSLDDIIVLKNPSRGIRQLLKRITGEEHSPLRVKVRVGHVIYVLSQILQSSYMYHLAKNSGHGVWGGVPGCFSDFKEGMNSQQMKIGPEFKKYRVFFAVFFNFTMIVQGNLSGIPVSAPGYMFYPVDPGWDNKDFPGEKYKENDV
jgi:hypothetical protein